MRKIRVRLGAAIHEIRCRECRVTWRSWLARATFTGGMEPSVARRRTPDSMSIRVYKVWAGLPPRERSRARWVMSQATLDQLGGGHVPLPACILGLPLRIDPDEPGMRLEQEKDPQWATTMTAWMWP